MAGSAGDKEHALTDIGHAAKVELNPSLLAGRAGQPRQPVRGIRIGLADRPGGDIQLERIVAAKTTDCMQRLGKALLGPGMDGKA